MLIDRKTFGERCYDTVLITADARLAVAVDKYALDVWDLSNGQCLQSKEWNEIEKVAMSDDGRLRVIDLGDAGIVVCNGVTGGILRQLSGHFPDDKTGSVARWQHKVLTDSTGRISISAVDEPRNTPLDCAWSNIPKGCGRDNTEHVRLVAQSAYWKRPLLPAKTIVLSNDGDYALSRHGDDDHTEVSVWLWNCRNGTGDAILNSDFILNGISRQFRGAICPFGESGFVWANNRNSFHIIDRVNKSWLHETLVDEAAKSFVDVDFTPDGQYAAAACKDGIHLWDISLRECLLKLPIDGAAQPICVSITADRRQIEADIAAPTSDGKSIRAIWDLAAGTYREEPMDPSESHRHQSTGPVVIRPQVELQFKVSRIDQHTIQITNTPAGSIKYYSRERISCNSEVRPDGRFIVGMENGSLHFLKARLFPSDIGN